MGVLAPVSSSWYSLAASMKHTIDAQGKTLGRVATAAAAILIGKHTTSFVKNKVGEDTVEIVNASKVAVTGSKMGEKRYKRYSGYPGGLKETPMREMIDKKGHAEILRIAVYGMLPKNKLRSIRIKKLSIQN